MKRTKYEKTWLTGLPSHPQLAGDTRILTVSPAHPRKVNFHPRTGNKQKSSPRKSKFNVDAMILTPFWACEIIF